MRVEDGLRERFPRMDPEEQGKLFRLMEERIGRKDLEAMMNSVFSSFTFDLEKVKRRASSIGDMDEEDFYDLCNHKSVPYRYPDEIADDEMWDAFETEFSEDVRRLLELGRKEDLERYVDVIIAGLEEAEGLLVDYSEDTVSCMVDTLRECLREGRIKDVFEGRGWYQSD